jgi:hypothetical protein
MAIRETRDARPGEVQAFIASHAKWAKTFADGGRSEIRFRPSPCCGHDSAVNPSCQVDSVKGMWRCFACGKLGNFYTLTKAFGDPLPPGDVYKDPLYQWNPAWFAQFEKKERRPVSGNHYPELLEYCHGRGISDTTLELWRVSTMGPGNLRWPIFLFDGTDGEWKMVNARMRKCLGEDGGPRDWYEIKGGATDLLIGNHIPLDLSVGRIIITEGQWDAMTLTEIGMKNVFSLPNGSNNIKVGPMLRYIPEDWEIWLAMDRDGAGDKAIETFFHQLGTERVARILTPTKDLNDWLLEKPDLAPADVEAVATGLTPRTIKSDSGGYMAMDMETPEEVESRLIVDTPFPDLNAYLAGGFYAGQTTGILAPSGLGKTTLVNQLGIWAANKGIPLGLISLEGPRVDLKIKIQETIRGACEKESWPITIGNMMISPLWGTKTLWQTCTTELRKMAEDGARLLIFDNLDFITRDDNTAKAQAYAEIIDICGLYGCHAIVCWQPNKVDRTKLVNSGNQKGYSQMLQDSDNYINLNRLKDYNVLEVEKCREKGVHGEGKIWVVYDQNKRAFNPTAEAPDTNLGNSGTVLSLMTPG